MKNVVENAAMSTYAQVGKGNSQKEVEYCGRVYTADCRLTGCFHFARWLIFSFKKLRCGTLD